MGGNGARPVTHGDLPTPVVVDALKELFANSSVSLDVQRYLVDGFLCGFSLGHVDQGHATGIPRNLESARVHPEVVARKLDQEVKAKRVAGPFQSSPFSNLVVSPVGVVPKKEPGKFRMIHHLSYPKGESVNDQISQECKMVTFDRIDDAVKAVQCTGTGCWLSKTDIASAYRIVPVNPSDYHLLGMVWDGQYYYDRCLPMGCASSCAIFQCFSTALKNVALEKVVKCRLCHILDDFLFISPSESGCREDLNGFLRMSEHIGVPISEEKTEGPSQVLVFLGIEIDTVKGELRLPIGKVEECRSIVLESSRRSKLTLRELQRLIGKLSFACSVVVPGRAFLRRLINMTIGLKSPFHKVRLNKGCKLDLEVWLSFLAEFNGRSMFLDEHWSQSVQVHLYTDAAGAVGFGAVLGRHWCRAMWPNQWKERGIMFKEAYPILVALHLWGEQLTNRRLLCHTDNMAVKSAVNSMTSKCPFAMAVIRQIVTLCLRHNILLRAEHIPGVQNDLADAISRFQDERFWKIVKEKGLRMNGHPQLIGKLPLL